MSELGCAAFIPAIIYVVWRVCIWLRSDPNGEIPKLFQIRNWKETAIEKEER